jgi:glucokinase
MNEIAIGVDLGGTNIKAGAVNRSGDILHKYSIPTEADKGADVVIDRIVLAAKECLDALSENDKPVGIGVGSPGPLHLETGVVVVAPNLPGFENIPLRDMVSEKTQLPCVLENDANAAALAEKWLGAGRNASSLVQFTLGTGIGGGIILNGEVWHGFNDGAAEIGHMSINPDGPKCNCGSRGCIEAYASATAMVRRIKEKIAAGTNSILADNMPAITARDIYEAAVKGDAAALENIRKTGFYLGVAVSNIMHILNPEVIVFSGGVTAAGDMLLNPIRETAEKMTMEACREGVKICLAELGNDAGLLGAAKSLFNQTTSITSPPMPPSPQ